MDKEKQAFEEWINRDSGFSDEEKEFSVYVTDNHGFGVSAACKSAKYFYGGYRARDSEVEQTRQQLFRAVKEVAEMGAKIDALKSERDDWKKRAYDLGEFVNEQRMVEMEDLKLFIWTGFSPDYADGLAFAIAKTETEARTLIELDRGFEVYTWGDLEILPVNLPVARSVCGGG